MLNKSDYDSKVKLMLSGLSLKKLTKTKHQRENGLLKFPKKSDSILNIKTMGSRNYR